ncbi:hypothetical protein ACQPZG_30175 [Streptomyces sp. CA-294286]
MWIEKASESLREAAAEATLPRHVQLGPPAPAAPSAPGHRTDPSPKG